MFLVIIVKAQRWKKSVAQSVKRRLEAWLLFLAHPGESMGYCGHMWCLSDSEREVFSYNKRTMDRAMGPFLPLWQFLESITYVLSI